jgi:hypothetical protein
VTLKSNLEFLRNFQLVEGRDIPSEGGNTKIKPFRMSLYSITPLGKKLLSAWTAFLNELD